MNNMKPKSITLRKGYMDRDTVKGSSGSYRSAEDQGEITMTFENKDGFTEKEIKELKDNVRKHAIDLKDDDPDWIKEGPTSKTD